MEWCLIFSIAGSRSRRRGAVGSRCWTYVNGHAQEGGAIWRRRQKGLARSMHGLLLDEMVEDGGGGLLSVHMRCALRVC